MSISLSMLFALHGKIVFYDGTYVVGKVTKVDEATVYIIPIGLDTAEGVLVGNIDSLKLENGMVPVISSAVKYFYQNGEFMANDDDWMDEYNDFQYDDYAMMQEEYQYEENQKSHQNYYQISAFGGVPFAVTASLKEEGGQWKSLPSFGASIKWPYFQFGALDVSPGLRLSTYHFEASHQGKVQALQIAIGASFDFKPVLYFLPSNIHASVDAMLTLNTAYDIDQNTTNFPNVPAEAFDDQSYNGIGMNVGASIDYWMKDLPLAFRLFGLAAIVPQAPPFTEVRSMIANVGASFIVVLKRHTKNNSN